MCRVLCHDKPCAYTYFKDSYQSGRQPTFACLTAGPYYGMDLGDERCTHGPASTHLHTSIRINMSIGNPFNISPDNLEHRVLKCIPIQYIKANLSMNVYSIIRVGVP
jgi:hypothetical protein